MRRFAGDLWGQIVIRLFLGRQSQSLTLTIGEIAQARQARTVLPTALIASYNSDQFDGLRTSVFVAIHNRT